ncbi:MAG: ABC transporter permease [Gemmatimonadales bacterium]
MPLHPLSRRASQRAAMAFDTIIQDARYAWRSLRKSPVLSLAAILTLGLGIGANAAMFGVVDAIFFRPPPHVVEPDRVVRLQSTPGTLRNYPRITDLRENARSFSAVAAYFGPRAMSLGQGEAARQVQVELVTAGFFPLLGVQPARGRFFTEQEDLPGGAANVAVVSDEFWKRQLAGTPEILGRTLRVGRSIYVVIGVAPPGFAGVDLQRPDIWLPMSAAAAEIVFDGALTCENCSWLQPIARLAPGVTPGQAGSEATVRFRRHPVQRNDSLTTVAVAGLNQTLGRDAQRGADLAGWLAAACAIVLLIACVNVANLLLALATQRRREMALRSALGSTRGRLVRQLYVESALLAFLGGVAALLATLWAGPVLRAALLPQATTTGGVDARVLMFTSLAAALTTFMAGLVPAFYARIPDLTSALKARTREDTIQGSLVRTGLLVGQVALTLVLLTGAGLFIRSLRQVQSLRLGFDPEQVIVASVNLAPIRPSPEAINADYQRIRERVAAIPGVESASLSIGVPFRISFGQGVFAPGLDSLPDMDGPYTYAVTPDYFRTLGTRVLQGRAFAETDAAGGAPVAVVSRSLARVIWADQNPVGKCLRVGEPDGACREIVGVVEDGRQDRLTVPASQVFLPLAQADQVFGSPVTSLTIRTQGRAEQRLGEIRRTIQATAPDLPYPAIEPMPELYADQMRPWRTGASLFSLFAELALLLAAVGLYGVLSYVMSQRTQEMGVRLALGAKGADLMKLIVGRGLRVAIIGALIGAVGALVAGRALASLLYGVSPYDPVTLAGGAGALLVVAFLASYLPARRAARVDPMVALREE